MAVFTKGHHKGGRPKGSKNRIGREEARRLIDDPIYRRNLKARLRNGQLAAGVETMLWERAYGKPEPAPPEPPPALPVTTENAMQLLALQLVQLPPHEFASALKALAAHEQAHVPAALPAPTGEITP